MAKVIIAMAAQRAARPGGGGVHVDGRVGSSGHPQDRQNPCAAVEVPRPATLETWVTDAGGDPLLVVMAQPGASLAAELRWLIPDLRALVGDERRVLVGFDRGGWSPTLFADLHAAGFDTLTWCKGPRPTSPRRVHRVLPHR